MRRWSLTTFDSWKREGETIGNRHAGCDNRTMGGNAETRRGSRRVWRFSGV